MLRGSNAIITGARTGIGLAILRQFAANGANCWAVLHRNTPEFQEEAAILARTHGVSIDAVIMNLEEEVSVKEGFREIVSFRRPVDILVNCAGITSPDRLFVMTPMSDIRRVMQVNFLSPLLLAQLAARSMMRHRSGRIINVASIAAFGEDTSQLEYAASKSALISATRKLARELGSHGISVNAIAPGLTDTRMMEQVNDESLSLMLKGISSGRLATPIEVANVALFLASDMSSGINGETIRVDGGGFDLRLFLNHTAIRKDNSI